jgi:hypothetical protein
MNPPGNLDLSRIKQKSSLAATMEPQFRSSQLLSSWFDENYEYRIEEGDLNYAPTKIEAVRGDGENFDDFYIESLKRRLQAGVFPPSLYALYFETDEFRRFVRIYIDRSNHGRTKKKIDQIRSWSVITMDEIRSRLAMQGRSNLLQRRQ